uniref:Uncharacterized protein n=1 Tax=Opuntia streptacantha TaxID=393608 RepID=A0A7C9EE23_OPUST
MQFQPKQTLTRNPEKARRRRLHRGRQPCRRRRAADRYSGAASSPGSKETHRHRDTKMEFGERGRRRLRSRSKLRLRLASERDGVHAEGPRVDFAGGSTEGECRSTGGLLGNLAGLLGNGMRV